MARMNGRAAEQPSAEVQMSMTAVCKVADIPPDGGLRVELPGRPAVAVFTVAGAVYVIDDRGKCKVATGCYYENRDDQNIFVGAGTMGCVTSFNVSTCKSK